MSSPPLPDQHNFNASFLPTLVVHGGAGNGTREAPEGFVDGVKEAAELGFAILQKGGSALDAVEAAVSFLEDHPLFNAGRGSALNRRGEVEMDASIMDGRDLSTGAVGIVRGVQNPVQLARKVLSNSPHVLLAGPGAEDFAREAGLKFQDPEWFITDRQREVHQRLLLQEKGGESEAEGTPKGTVGAVAVDLQGNVAAATSTGGTALKLPGRMGDSPIAGAGTWADNETGAISCTGDGEAIIRTNLAKWTADRLAAGMNPQVAAQRAVDWLGAKVQGEGGVIVLNHLGQIGWAMNTRRMARAFMRPGMRRAQGAVEAPED